MSSASQSDVARMDQLTTKIHTSIYPAIDSTTIKLPSPFVVCIIGASTGIGEHAAYAYAKAGASAIVIASSRLEPLEVVAERCRKHATGYDVQALECDITSSASVKALAEQIEKHHGRLDVLISNPGYAGPVTLKVTGGSPADF